MCVALLSVLNNITDFSTEPIMSSQTPLEDALETPRRWDTSKQGTHNGPICRKRSFKWPYLILWSNIGPPFAWKVRYFYESQINQYSPLKWRKNSKYMEMQRLSLSECYVVDEYIDRRSRKRRKCFKRVKRSQSWNRKQERRGGNINAGFTISGLKVRFFGQILVRYSPKK